MKTKSWAGLAAGLVMFGMAGMANAALIAQWNFDEAGGSTAFASVGGVNGTLVGGASFTGTGGVSGGALQLTNGYVTMGNNFPATSAFSIEAWVNILPGTVAGMIPVGKHWSTKSQGYFLSINNIGDGYTKANTQGFYSANGGYITAVGGPGISAGVWHQLVGVYNNGVTGIYVDGTLIGTGSAGFSNNTADFMVGAIFNSAGVRVNTFQGLIDQVSVYNNALTGNEVSAIYNNTLNPVAPVPVPATMLLFGAGMAGLVGVRNKRTKK